MCSIACPAPPRWPGQDNNTNLPKQDACWQSTAARQRSSTSLFSSPPAVLQRFTFGTIRDTINSEALPLAKNSKQPGNSRKTPAFDVQEYLNNTGKLRRIVKFKKGQSLFSQDDPCNDVWYIQSGNAKLSIVNPQGKEAVLAILGPGDFLGEGCIIGNPVRMATATALATLSATIIDKQEMMRVLHEQPAFAEKFIHYMLERNIKIEADLVDQLFNSSEKRLARALLILARYGKKGEPETLVAKISQETLAELVGTTRSRVNFFMNKFRKLGFIHYNGGLQVHSSLLNVVLHD
jgi:CRP/FNR family cyclic AMP-dependent transcriptional regulator